MASLTAASRVVVNPLALPGLLLGLGVGGFIDGIVLHQLLQWHHMRTGTACSASTAHTVAGLEANTLGEACSIWGR